MAATAVRYPTPQRVDGSTQHTSVEVTDPLLRPPELVVVTRVSRPCICLCWGGYWRLGALPRRSPCRVRNNTFTAWFHDDAGCCFCYSYMSRAGFERFARARVSRRPYGTRQSLDEPCRRPERLSRSSAAMGRAQCITATPRKRGLHSFKVLEDHRQPAASDRRTTKATFSSRHFRPRWRRL